jgi:hypothetical protein
MKGHWQSALSHSLHSSLLVAPSLAVVSPEGQRWQGVMLERNPSLQVPMGHRLAVAAAAALLA